jgi:hypothetical protein
MLPKEELMNQSAEPACCLAVQKVSLPVQALALATHGDYSIPGIYIFPV